MILRYSIFSICLSLLSIALVFFAPFNVSTQVQSVESLYAEEIEKLRSKEYLDTEEKHLLDRYVQESNQYLLSQPRQYNQESAWRKKSDYLAPLIMMLWGGAFYYFYGRYKFRHFYVVNAIPVLLVLIGVMSVIEVVLILVAVFFVVVVNSIKEGSEKSA